MPWNMDDGRAIRIGIAQAKRRAARRSGVGIHVGGRAFQ